MLQPIIAGTKLNEAMVRTVELQQELGAHHHCIVDFSRDDLIQPRLEDFLGKPIIIEASVPDGSSVKIFEGFVSRGTLEHQLYGGAAIILEGISHSSKLDWSRREAYYKQ